MPTRETRLGQGTLHRFGRCVNANAALDSLVTRFAVEAREATQAHLAALFAEANLAF
jgi:hypothetical protein